MLTTARTRESARQLLIGGLLMTAAAGQVPGQAATAHDYSHPVPDPVSHEFRASHPFRVFVDVENRHDRGARGANRRAGRGTDPADHYVRDKLHYRLPGNIVLVSDRRDADMIVRAQLMHYDLAFHITDVDRRNKKYKKKYRYTPGRCGHHKRAYYTRVTEKGVAIADYQLSFRLRGDGSYKDAVQIRAAESYRYGENLSALTNCGVAPSVHFPNKTVARLFSQADGRYRETLAREIHSESLRNLAHVLAGSIETRADQFYINLANAEHALSHSHGPKAGVNVYDFDDVDERQGQRRLNFTWWDD